MIMALSEPAEFGHPDFILLDEVTEAAFMANLKLRYEKGKVWFELTCHEYMSGQISGFCIAIKLSPAVE